MYQSNVRLKHCRIGTCRLTKGVLNLLWLYIILTKNQYCITDKMPHQSLSGLPSCSRKCVGNTLYIINLLQCVLIYKYATISSQAFILYSTYSYFT